MQKIVELLKNNCCVFIGAGIPNSLGFPLWDKLANDLIGFVWSKKDNFNKKEFPISMKQELENRVKGEPLTVITYCRDLLFFHSRF